MENQKSTIAVVCGGRSLEHSFSIVSANNIASHLEKKYKVVILCINFDGNWHYGFTKDIINHHILLDASFNWEDTPIIDVCKNGKLFNQDGLIACIDVVFPITNGVDGHQGAIPGMMKLLDIPCVGSDIFETVVCIDKEITKSLLENYTLPVVPYLVGRQTTDYTYNEVVQKLGTPFFVKPCRLSSSAGISKVNSKNEYKAALHEALRFDDKFLLEVAILGRELECAIIGNEKPWVSPILGEVVCDDFYCYDSKYQGTSTSQIIFPAILENDIKDKILEYSKKAYKVLGCKGFARIDFFLDKENNIYINEATTLPLFTGISMFPKLWENNIEQTICTLVELSYKK